MTTQVATKPTGIYAELQSEIDAGQHPPLKATGLPDTTLGWVVAAVLQLLRSQGVGFLSSLTWLPVILDLIVKYGPLVEQIAQQVLDLIRGGGTVASFYAARAA